MSAADQSQLTATGGMGRQSMALTDESARRVAESIGRAKNALLLALAEANASGDARLAGQISALCGKAETLQRKVAHRADC